MDLLITAEKVCVLNWREKLFERRTSVQISLTCGTPIASSDTEVRKFRKSSFKVVREKSFECVFLATLTLYCHLFSVEFAKQHFSANSQKKRRPLYFTETGRQWSGQERPLPRGSGEVQWMCHPQTWRMCSLHEQVRMKQPVVEMYSDPLLK